MKNINRRQFTKKASWLTGSALLSSAAPVNYPVVHHVFFWLKNPQSVSDRDKLVAGVKTLAKIKSVRQLHVGIVAGTEKRDVVDQSWAVSELIFFSDLAGQETYQSHPVHLEFIKNYSHLWDKVVVYDAQNV
ncbi:Dabb family protein [Mucilaginibacter sp. Bleaf8]|uniref:Dabb family protein n=1 Tax=Mucilaginibacter sp. Bleaf8 TaxID=2834430 RepID=UPI001BCEDFF7|nr:Dabb family protein [Mucilaginibacter sp. Bleaf8]MBS7562992.1 Dabb family protein [Mucilaginibacter sp. Bleaf8]